MNQLETAILNGARSAHGRYRQISGGWWLWHAPESFIMTWVASHVEANFASVVYLDCSVKKLNRKLGRAKRGRPERRKVRYDLVIWKKARNDVRALVEIKKAYTLNTLQGDVKKLRKYRPKHRGRGRPPLKHRHPWAAYLLIYTEAPGKNHKCRLAKLAQRGNEWAKNLRCELVGIKQSRRTRDDDKHDWSIYLFRLCKRRKRRGRPRKKRR